MKPLALAALMVLGLTSAAAAECAWVLWSEDSWIVFYAKDERPREWRLIQVFPNQGQCERAVSEKVKFLATEEGSSITSNIVSKRFADDKTRQVRVICVPDSVDPRGPKGK